MEEKIEKQAKPKRIRPKRFYFLMYGGQVFALEPVSRTLIHAVKSVTPGATAGEQPLRLAKTTLDSLGLPAGRRQYERAPTWLYNPLKDLIAAKLNQTVYAFTTPLPPPLVAFMAREPWTEIDQMEWEEKQRRRNKKKKINQREHKKLREESAYIFRKKRLEAKKALGWINDSKDEESE